VNPAASPQEAPRRRATPDPGQRKRAKRSGREQGCWTYIDGESLRRAGFTPGGELPFYRVLGYARSKNAGSAIVSLYREP
jgi:hypothetical protein